MSLGGFAAALAGGGLTAGLGLILWPICAGGLTLGPWQAWRGAERLARRTRWWHAAALAGGFVALATVLMLSGAGRGGWAIGAGALALWAAGLAAVLTLALWGDGRDDAVRAVLDMRGVRPSPARRRLKSAATDTARRAA